jgi:hypothetical protein
LRTEKKEQPVFVGKSETAVQNDCDNRKEQERTKVKEIKMIIKVFGTFKNLSRHLTNDSQLPCLNVWIHCLNVYP